MPAEYLAQAVAPLVIDPLILTLAMTSSDVYDELQPECAFDATTGRWLVVWERYARGDDLDIAYRLVTLRSNLSGQDTPAVASREGSAGASRRFMVTWQEYEYGINDYDVWAALYDAP